MAVSAAAVSVVVAAVSADRLAVEVGQADPAAVAVADLADLGQADRVDLAVKDVGLVLVDLAAKDVDPADPVVKVVALAALAALAVKDVDLGLVDVVLAAARERPSIQIAC